MTYTALHRSWDSRINRGEFPVGDPFADRATRDALKHMLADTQNPREYASYASAEIVEMLLSATRSDAWYVTEAVAKRLRPHGLCEFGGNGLTAFAMVVRRELKAMDA